MKSYSYEENLARFPVRDGFRIRGENMSRIEVFTDAAFAFAITLLAISLDGIPKNYPDFIHAIKDIPAFAASFAQLTLFWYAHRVWSQRYGLEDIKTVVISCFFIFQVLIFVFPLKISFGAFLHYASNGYLPAPMAFGAAEIKIFFIVFHISFLTMCLTMVWLYRHALSQSKALMLNHYEMVETKGQLKVWVIMSLTCFIGLILAIVLPSFYSAMSGAIYGTFAVSLGIHGNKLDKQLKSIKTNSEE